MSASDRTADAERREMDQLRKAADDAAEAEFRQESAS